MSTQVSNKAKPIPEHRALFEQIRDLSCADQILEPSKTKLQTKPSRAPSYDSGNVPRFDRRAPSQIEPNPS